MFLFYVLRKQVGDKPRRLYEELKVLLVHNVTAWWPSDELHLEATFVSDVSWKILTFELPVRPILGLSYATKNIARPINKP